MFIASLILLQVIIFAGLIFVLRKVMTKNVISATSHLEELNVEYSKKEREVNRQSEEIKQKAQEIVRQSENEAQNLKTQIIKEAESQRDELIKQARRQSEEIMQQADKSRQKLLAEIEEKISKEAAQKACELIQDTLPEKFKQDIHLEWVQELIEDGFSQLERLRIPQDIKEIKVTCAFSLTEGQRKNLLKKLKEVVAGDITLKEEVDTKVVAGIIITIGSLVLDGSLKNKIQERVKSV